MTPPTELETADTQTVSPSGAAPASTVDLDDVPYDVEMSLFDHLEELRQRIFYSLIAVVLAIVACFWQVRPIVSLLEVPAQGVKFLQLSPGEYFLSLSRCGLQRPSGCQPVYSLPGGAILCCRG
jgi:sec-independent protein translocase protein TatC